MGLILRHFFAPDDADCGKNAFFQNAIEGRCAADRKIESVQGRHPLAESLQYAFGHLILREMLLKQAGTSLLEFLPVSSHSFTVGMGFPARTLQKCQLEFYVFANLILHIFRFNFTYFPVQFYNFSEHPPSYCCHNRNSHE